MSHHQNGYDQFKNADPNNISEKSPWRAPRLSEYDILGSTAETADRPDTDTPVGLAGGIS